MSSNQPKVSSKRHCWECRKRNVVCDLQRPGCKQCSDESMPCPGYNERWRSKLRWVEPGRVSSRNRKSKNKEPHDDKPSSSKKKDSARNPVSAERTTVNHFDLIELAGEDSIALKYALDFLYEIVLPKLVVMGELRGFPSSVYIVSPEIFQAAVAAPQYIRYGMVNMALCHQMARVRQDKVQAAALLSIFLRFRGEMIRSLTNDISIEEKRSDKMVFAGIFQLLIAEIAHGLSDGWRYHFEAAYKFMRIHGGLRLMAEYPETRVLVLVFAYIAVIADSSSPAAEQILTPQDTSHIEFLIELLPNDDSSMNTYPTYTFIQILRINHLRALGTRYGIPPQDLTEQAYEIMNGLNGFSVDKWAEPKIACKEDNILLGHVYKVAVSLYGLSALGSLSILPSTSPIDLMALHSHAQLLYCLLQQAVPNDRLKIFMTWPLMILGVVATGAQDLGMRDSVRKWSEEVCTFTGSFSVLHQRDVLERFWSSGKNKWDECFDKPYLFTPVTNLDIAGLA